MPDSLSTDDLVRRGLKFSQLRLLASLREFGKIAVAAQHVGMTQPAASRLLAQLDTMVGTPLYTRHPRGIELTEAGRILAAQATEMLRDLDRAHQRIAQIRGGERGHVRIGSVTGPSLEILLPAIREARHRFPDIEITIRIETSDRLAEALIADDIDFYIGRVIEGGEAQAFSFSVIATEPVGLLVRADHPLIWKVDLALADCLSFDWVMQPPGGLLRRTTEAYLRQRGLPMPEHVLGTSSTLFTLALINETNAIAPVARAVAEFFVARAALRDRLATLPVARDMSVSNFGIVSRYGDAPSPATERILGLVRRHSSQVGGTRADMS